KYALIHKLKLGLTGEDQMNLIMGGINDDQIKFSVEAVSINDPSVLAVHFKILNNHKQNKDATVASSSEVGDVQKGQASKSFKGRVKWASDTCSHCGKKEPATAAQAAGRTERHSVCPSIGPCGFRPFFQPVFQELGEPQKPDRPHPGIASSGLVLVLPHSSSHNGTAGARFLFGTPSAGVAVAADSVFITRILDVGDHRQNNAR
ncbi:hypothetical protein NQ318_004973, partial [Aromia moschata]